MRRTLGRWTGLAVAGFAAALLVERPARAEESPRFVLERGPEADSCPDQAAFTELVLGVRGPNATAPSALEYQVRFAHRDTRFEVTIESANGGTRSLSDAAVDCGALGRAAAVSLALLIDAEQSEPAPTQAAASTPPKTAPLPKRATVDSTSDESGSPPTDPSWLELNVGALALGFVLRPVAPALSAGVGAGSGAVRGGAAALWAPPTELRLGEGTVHPSLVGVALDLCYAPVRSTLRLDSLCSGLLAGFIRAEARGFTTNESREKRWFSIPIGAALGTESGSLAWQLGASLVVPLRQQQFEVGGVGVAYRAPAIGALVFVRGAARIEL